MPLPTEFASSTAAATARDAASRTRPMAEATADLAKPLRAIARSGLWELHKAAGNPPSGVTGSRVGFQLVGSHRRPRNTLALDAQLTDRRLRSGHPREVLLVGELAKTVRVELAERGAVLTVAETIHDAFVLLAARDFDVVVVNPYAGGCGLDFVNCIKEGDADHQHTVATLYGARGTAAFLRGVKPPAPESLETARARHRTTPFVVLPSAEDWKYEVIVVPPQASFVVDVRKVPLVTSILCVDPATLLMTAEPMA